MNGSEIVAGLQAKQRIPLLLIILLQILRKHVSLLIDQSFLKYLMKFWCDYYDNLLTATRKIFTSLPSNHVLSYFKRFIIFKMTNIFHSENLLFRKDSDYHQIILISFTQAFSLSVTPDMKFIYIYITIIHSSIIMF